MATRRVKLTFPPDLIRQPIIYELGRRYAVVTNVRRADVTATYGWVVLELDGDDDEIHRALAWAGDVGVQVAPVEGDLIEG